MRILFLVCFLCLGCLWSGADAFARPSYALTQEAGAFSTPWQSHIGGRSRLVIGRHLQTFYAALEMELRPGWHSYWKYPGASGIAPHFDWSKARGIKTGRIIFPAPYFFDDGVGGFNGYVEHIIFPTQFEVSAPDAQLNLMASLGICRELCVPTHLSFTLLMPKAGVSSPFSARIREALARRPAVASERLRVASLTYDGIALRFTVIGKNLDDVRIIPIPPPNMVLGGQHVAARAKKSWLVEFPAHSVIGDAIIGKTIHFLVRNGDFAIEQKVKIRHTH